MTAFVCDNRRRLLTVKLAGTLNGIEHLEVRDRDETEPSRKPLRQRTLLVRLLNPVPATLTRSNVAIDGGERIGTVPVEWAAPATALPPEVGAAESASILDGLAEPDHVLVVRSTTRGDFSRYRFALVIAAGNPAAPAGFDPLLAEVSFSFKVECPSEFDCAARCTCPAGVVHAPPIDYLAKDYQGFRRLMLDRMGLLAPGWTERASADVGVAVVEMLAFVADELSYRQDAVATEAYLGTARSRVSLRRHARLVDYRVHDGCNTQVWVQVRVSGSTVVLPAGTTLLSAVPGLPAAITPDSSDHEAARAAGPVVFETVEEAVLNAGLDELRFWTWGEQDCCLPAGATSATVRGHHPRLRAGEVVVLAETVSPTTLADADADPTRRVAVRLVDVRSATDPSGALFPGGTTDVTEIRWHRDDALASPLRLSVGDTETAKVWGNLVLADHGETLADEPVGVVPASGMVRVRPGDRGGPAVTVRPRFRPTLARRPLTRAAAGPDVVLAEAPLTAALSAELATGASGDRLQSLLATRGLVLPDGSTVRGGAPRWSVSSGGRAWLLRERAGNLQVVAEAGAATTGPGAGLDLARPALSLVGTLDSLDHTWTVQPDLLGSSRTARELTVETEHDGTAYLRFGDGEHAQAPPEGTEFAATYRVGNGSAGNVGRAAIAHAVTTVSGITGVENPLPATGGQEPETGDEVRRNAPAALLVHERAVTEPDYAEVAMRSGEVERAAATFRWTGSWHTVFVTADRFGNAPVDADFERDLRGHLERFRMAGYDLEVDAPVFVPLEIGLHVCVRSGFHRSDVAVEVRAVLSDAAQPDGRLGLFHPDRLTFGQPVHLSAVLAQVHSVPGVQSVEVRTFQRQRQPASSGIDAGVLAMGRLEIARLDDDPSFPEHGVLDLTLGGGS